MDVSRHEKDHKQNLPNTVNGPCPARVSTKSAAIRAATNVVNLPSSMAISTIVGMQNESGGLVILGEGAIVLLVPRNSLLEKLWHQMRLNNGGKSSVSISSGVPREKNTLPFFELVVLS